MLSQAFSSALVLAASLVVYECTTFSVKKYTILKVFMLLNMVASASFLAYGSDFLKVIVFTE